MQPIWLWDPPCLDYSRLVSSISVDRLSEMNMHHGFKLQKPLWNNFQAGVSQQYFDAQKTTRPDFGRNCPSTVLCIAEGSWETSGDPEDVHQTVQQFPIFLQKDRKPENMSTPPPLHTLQLACPSPAFHGPQTDLQLWLVYSIGFGGP